MEQAAAVNTALNPFMTPNFRKESWDNKEESKLLAAEIVSDFKKAKKLHSPVKPFSEFLSEREQNLKRPVSCLRDMQSALLEFVMKIRATLSFIASLTKADSKPDGGGKKPDGGNKKPDGGHNKTTKSYKDIVAVDKSPDIIPPCKVCGENGDNSHHAQPKGCPFERDKHPERNKTHPTWKGSNAAKDAKQAGHDKLPWRKLLDGTAFELTSTKKSSIPIGNRKKEVDAFGKTLRSSENS